MKDCCGGQLHLVGSTASIVVPAGQSKQVNGLVNDDCFWLSPAQTHLPLEASYFWPAGQTHLDGSTGLIVMSPGHGPQVNGESFCD